MRQSPPRLAITPGEPAGIGPDLVLLMAQQENEAELIAIADQDLLAQRAKQLNLPIQLIPFEAAAPVKAHQAGQLRVVHTPLVNPVTTGQLDSANSPYVLNTLEAAVALCREGIADALVTGPVHKGIINEAGIPFTGHTEFLAELSQTPQVVMMLACPGLRVALVTTHLPLAEVSQQITSDRLERVIQILQHDMQQRFGIEKPRILVCGLNPHAGEEGHLGREELEIINPVLARLNREAGMNLIGPLPADTLFIPKYLAEADAVLAMYHDQGLPVLKHMGFGKAINITLGLPFIRTSVDHGTALELAGSGEASLGSLYAAIATATELATSSHPSPALAS